LLGQSLDGAPELLEQRPRPHAAGLGDQFRNEGLQIGWRERGFGVGLRQQAVTRHECNLSGAWLVSERKRSVYCR
jgi:hypothetical protein